MNLPVAQSTPKFLKDKPLDVRLYAPRLIEPTSSVRPCARPTRRSHDSPRRFYVFEGDFPRSGTSGSNLPPHDTAGDVNEHGERIPILSPSQLSSCFAVRLLARRAKHQHSADVSTNHAPGCNWDNYEQLEYSRNQDAGAFLCNPCFTLLKTWKRITATIVAARQESANLSKEGKTLLAQVLSSLMAKQNPTPGCCTTDERSGH
jgi:hypothetical protein